MKLSSLALPARLAAIAAMAGFGGALTLNADIHLPLFATPFEQVRDWILAAVLLALAARLVESRKEGVLVLAAWYAGSLASLPFIWSSFFGTVWGWAAYACLVVALALPALLAPRRWPAIGIVVAIAIAAVPPLGFVGMGNPILLAGALFPGAGWVGLGLTLVVFALSAVNGGRGGKLAVMGQLAALAWAMVYLATPQPQPPEMAWAATTYFGANPETNLNATYDAQDKAKAMVTDALRAGAKLVVLPEGTDKIWGAGQAFYWHDVADLARAKHAQVLIGVYTDPMERDRADALVDLTGGRLYPASIAVPFGMWAPWRKNGDFPLHFDAGRTIKTQYGRAAYLICYEELLPWPLMLQALHGRPALLVSAANQWFGRGWLLRPQERSVALQARLWGLPVLRAVNHAPVE